MDTDDSADENGRDTTRPKDEFSLSNEDSQDEHASNARAENHLHSTGHAPVSFQQRKWKRLREHYDDQYLDLFTSTFEPEQSKLDLGVTQLGATLWQPEEKARLYGALARTGRHNIDRLASAIGTKSVVEVKAYLDSLREQDTDRQRFQAHPKNVSHAEIPAAIEIGAACEAVLDRAANALLAFQEQYDFVAGRPAGGLWLIDHTVAEELDQKTDDTEDAYGEDGRDPDNDDPSISSRAISLFHLSTFLDLCEDLFMQEGSGTQFSWRNIAEQGQRPGLMLESVTHFYDLIVSFLQRIMQSCIFIAQSRIRACTNRDYRPTKIVKHEDVVTALDILGVKNNSKQYWMELARKNNWHVVDDSHRRHGEPKAILSYDEVEERLSRSRSGGSRSVSMVRRPLLEDDTQPEEAPKDVVTSGGVSETGDSADQGDGSDGTEDEAQSPDQLEGATKHNPSSEDEGDSSVSERDTQGQTSRRKRSRVPEDDHDEYLERMDQAARKQEESRLLSLLSAEEDTKQTIEDEGSDDPGTRPLQPRKSVEDCMGWSISYEAEWESEAKRRRLNPIQL